MATSMISPIKGHAEIKKQTNLSSNPKAQTKLTMARNVHLLR